MKVNESIKTIFYVTQHALLLGQATFKTEHTQFSKLCPLKLAILVKKKHFRNFEPLNNRNESKQVLRNHFLP